MKLFFSRDEPLLAPMNDPFVQLDREVTARKLSLRERGTELGALNLPPSDTATFDNVETEVVTTIGQHYAQAQIETANSIRTYDRRLSELALLSKLSSIRTEARRAVSDFSAEVLNRRNRLSNSRDGILSSYSELGEFKLSNGLKRPAHAVPPAIATVGTIALAWLFETAMNSILLRLNDDLGYLGGLVAAAIVGAINVILAAFVGHNLWPRTNLRSIAAKTSAWIGIAGWVTLMLVWNLLAAHFRDAKSLGIPSPEKAAITMMGSGLESIYSWGLFVLGVIFALTAAMAGFRMDDPFPGYGLVSRRHIERCEDYAEEVQQATDELREIRDDGIEGATAIRQELERQLAEHNQVLVARESYLRRYDEFGIQLEQIANALLQEYRAANRASRSDPEPAHFKDSWKLPRKPMPVASMAGIKTEDVESAEVSLDQAVSETIAAFNAAIASFESLDTLKQDLANG